MKFVCDDCGTRYHIDDKKVRGKILRIRCKKCSHVITVREPARVSRPIPTQPPLAAVQTKVDWFYSVNGQSSGAIDEETLLAMFAAGRVGDEAYVWNAGFDAWKPAFDVPVFSSAIAKWKEAERLAGKPATEKLSALQVDELKLDSRQLPAVGAEIEAEHEVFARASHSPVAERTPAAAENAAEVAAADMFAETALPASFGVDAAQEVAPDTDETASVAEDFRDSSDGAEETPAKPSAVTAPAVLEETKPVLRQTLEPEAALPATEPEDEKPTVDVSRQSRALAASGDLAPLDELSTSGVQRLLADKEKSGMAASKLEKLRSALRTRRAGTPASGTATLHEPQTSDLAGSLSSAPEPRVAEVPAETRAPLGASASLDLPAPPKGQKSAPAPNEDAVVSGSPAGPIRQTEAQKDSAGAQAVAEMVTDDGAPLAPTPTVNLEAPDELQDAAPALVPAADALDLGEPIAPPPTVNLEAPDDGEPIPATPTVNLEADEAAEPAVAESEGPTPSPADPRSASVSIDAGSSAGFGELAAEVGAQAPVAGIRLDGLTLGTGSVADPEASASASLLFQVKQARAGKRRAALGVLLFLLVAVAAVVFVLNRETPAEEPVVEVEPTAVEPVLVEDNAASSAQSARNLQVATIRAGRAIGAAWDASIVAAAPAPEPMEEAESDAEEPERRASDEDSEPTEVEEEPERDIVRLQDRNGLALPTPRVGPSEARSDGPAPDHFDEGMRSFINSSIARCNQRHIAQEGELEQPRVEISITVLPSGRVRELELERSLRETAFGRCLQSHRERWLFPSFGGDSVTLRKTYVVR